MRGGGGSDRIPFLLFSYIFKYFAGYLDLISDLGDRDALEIRSQTSLWAPAADRHTGGRL